MFNELNILDKIIRAEFGPPQVNISPYYYAGYAPACVCRHFIRAEKQQGF